ncbi:MAG TPA: D-glycero-beta-D-manno-heptose 1-phosphate adenylyltransferase, partial [Proteobacteria bacterium]|nr:D-glycero-beta-D-manno-heptose 1-phosphate adenylyltransferase [Pseudomonadota bacterium]
HVRYLQAAAQLGDFLIVAVNSDESTKQLKGEGRPLVPERERAEMVSAIEGVDAVVIFGESTVESLLRAIRPHVHAKGTDYTKETVPERDVAKELGIEIAIVGDRKDHSVTDILNRIAKRITGEGEP